jgi:hypothetical protein
MADVIVIDQGKHLGFIDIAGIGFGVQDTIGVLGKGLAIIDEIFPYTANRTVAQTGKLTQTQTFTPVELGANSLQMIPVLFAISFFHIHIPITSTKKRRYQKAPANKTDLTARPERKSAFLT